MKTIPGTAVLYSALISSFTTIQAQAPPMMIPAGTPVLVRTIDPIDVRSAWPGATFRGSLDAPMTGPRGNVLIPRGAPVQLGVVSVKKSNRISGRDRIELTVNSIAYRGRSYAVVTTVAEFKGKGKGGRTLRRTGIGAGAGALVGGLLGGGTGAAAGALVGGGGGTAVAAATGGKHLSIPPESVVSFQLRSPARIP